MLLGEPLGTSQEQKRRPQIVSGPCFGNSAHTFNQVSNKGFLSDCWGSRIGLNLTLILSPPPANSFHSFNRYLFGTYYVPGTNFHAVISGKQDYIFTFKKIIAGPQIMQLCSTSFCYNVDEMQEPNSCLCQSAYGNIGFMMCHFAAVPRTYPRM